MKLNKIKLSGFKSFVDQTTIPIHSNLTAVVGPNGCGKSNVIDAVRWVMGEISAKNLRGDSMVEVIFNGSISRKPVSMTTVELIFDNSCGKIGGEYANYNTISIKRQLSRDGVSLYTLNNSRCRRKDITDLFLGTGLGVRSYAVIEQGTISKLIESKPEELRIHIEEAAGISKYKERRHEAETHMRNTRENLKRLDDIREEVSKQLTNLKKQAEQAIKFTALKKQERIYKQELLTLHWNKHNHAVKQLEVNLHTITDKHNSLLKSLQEIDKSVEDKRTAQKQQQQQLSSTQKKSYAVIAEISNIQQTIKHNKSIQAETKIEVERLKQQVKAVENDCNLDKQQLLKIIQDLKKTQEEQAITTEKTTAKVIRQQQLLDTKMEWQKQWEDYLIKNAKNMELIELQEVKLSHLSINFQQLQQRLEKLQNESDKLSSINLQTKIQVLDDDIKSIKITKEELQQRLKIIYTQIIEQQKQIKQQQNKLHLKHAKLHQLKGKITALKLLQRHALGKEQQNLSQWLEKMNLSDVRYLAEFLEVDEGWDTAVEIVLCNYLEAICLDNYQKLIPGFKHLTNQSIVLFETRDIRQTNKENKNNLPKLLDKTSSPWDLSGILTGIYCTEDIESAIRLKSSIQNYESIITKDGIWMGLDWIKILHANDSKIGVLQRQKEISLLTQQLDDLNQKIQTLEAQINLNEKTLKETKNKQETLQQKDKILASKYSLKSTQLSACSVRQQQQQQRIKQISDEIEEITFQITDTTKYITEAKDLKLNTAEISAKLNAKETALKQKNQTLNTQLDEINLVINLTQKTTYTAQGKIESLKVSETLTNKQIERLQKQILQAKQRIDELEKQLNSTLMPGHDEKSHCEKLIKQQQELEQKLRTENNAQQNLETQISQKLSQRVIIQQDLEQQKELVNKTKLAQQESNVRLQTLLEQLNQFKINPEQVLKMLSPKAEIQQWKHKLESYSKQVTAMAPINLAAIEEYKSQKERIDFLNAQRTDLIESLNTLNRAISKIDTDSKQRFKQTFDKINLGLQDKFPKLFGGGQAYLELTEQNTLSAGVNIIAKPPGKKNSSIHILSGGEKALTAIALVFSIFDLNPAPFCLLDEVDASLDDINVIRFARMMEQMSETVQFLYISHNKITMEIAKQLIGITMAKQGVSSVACVDIEAFTHMVKNHG